MTIEKGRTVYARLASGATGDVADILKLAGADLEKITLSAHKTTQKSKSTSKSKSKVKTSTITVQAHHLEDWSKPFGLKDTKL